MAITNGQIDVAALLIDHADDAATPTGGGARRSGRRWISATSPSAAARRPTRTASIAQAALEVIAALLERGADVNARVKEFPPMRRYLLPLASLEWVDVTGQTAFIRAAQSGDLPVMRLLLSKGADPKITTFNGTTALMAAAGVNWVVGETFSESPAVDRSGAALSRLGLDVNAVNQMGLQAVHGAANRGSDDIIELLARHGAALDRPDKEGRTPYVWAQGVFLATNSPVAKPSTMALLDRLTSGAASRKKPRRPSRSRRRAVTASPSRGRLACDAAPGRPAAAAPDPAFLKQYCLGCHNERTQERQPGARGARSGAGRRPTSTSGRRSCASCAPG